MLLVVFGAGASYDSILSRANLGSAVDPHQGSRPPLAKDLFTPHPVTISALERYFDVGALFAKLADGGGEVGVEAKLTELWEHAQDYADRKRQFIALRYYLNQVIQQSQGRWLSDGEAQLNHFTLFDDIKRLMPMGENALLVTFNYDMLIEKSLAKVEHHISGLDAFVGRKRFNLLKLHGSIDWLHETTLGGEQGVGYDHTGAIARILDNANGLEMGATYFTRAQALHRATGFSLVPAIAVPMSVKRTFECPAAHLAFLESELPKVTHLLCIGWRGQEGHFLQLMRKHATKAITVAVVSENETNANATYESIASSGVRVVNFQRQHRFVGGFSRFIKESEGESFLRLAFAKTI